MNQKPARRILYLSVTAVLVLAIVVVNRQRVAWLPCYQAKQRMSAGRLQDARWWLQVARRIGGDNSATAFYESRWARKTGQLDEASELLRRAESLGLSAAQVARERILIQAQAGEVKEGQHTLLGLLRETDRDAPEVCEAFILGFIKTHTSLRFSVEVLTLWISDHPDDPRPHLLLAAVHREAQDLEGTIRELRLALKADPDHAQAALELGQIMFKRHELNEAGRLFKTAVRSASMRREALEPEALVWQATYLRMVGRHQEARAILQSVLRDDPDWPPANIQQAQLEIASREYDAAIQRLQRVLKRPSYRREARLALVTALRAAGRDEEADQHDRKAREATRALIRARQLTRDLDLDPGNVALRSEIGHIHLQHGEPQRARHWLRSALLLDPDHQPTRSTLARHFGSQPPKRDP